MLDNWLGACRLEASNPKHFQAMSRDTGARIVYNVFVLGFARCINSRMHTKSKLRNLDCATIHDAAPNNSIPRPYTVHAYKTLCQVGQTTYLSRTPES